MKNKNSLIERKNTDNDSVLDVDTEKRMVKIAIASMGDIDRDDDIFDSKAFNNTIRQKGPSGSNEVWHLLDHGWGIASAALSKPKELFIEGNKLCMVSPYRDTFNWKNAWALYEAGDINQHSVGFSVMNSIRETRDGKEIRVITEASLWEGSAVLWGANANTPTLEVVKNWLDNYQQEQKEPIGQRFNRIYKQLKDGKVNEENVSLLKIEFKYLEQYIIELEERASESAEKAIETAKKEQEKMALQSVLDSIKSFNNNPIFQTL